MPIFRLLTSLDGRIGRGEYWLGLALIAVGLFLGAGLAPFLTDLIARTLFTTALFVAALLASVAVNGKRFQDRAKPRGLAWIGILIPLLAFLAGASGLPARYEMVESVNMALAAVNTIVLMWFIFELGFLPGTAGPNRYGEDPRENALGRRLLAWRD